MFFFVFVFVPHIIFFAKISEDKFRFVKNIYSFESSI